eukprot:TRINITY_DN28747_c0_g1_i1.p1 TRINITY_DN28747_c0_g1~~TRINITY_DN28747_c0_g1_i1.p1  ORF type:complete len:129 (+),score=28.14 TRINITY_DN28747_c0_g1_i1:137-523(+)
MTTTTISSLLNPIDSALVIGIKFEGETAEVNFSRLDAAERACETLNGNIIKGQKVKAILVNEANDFQNKLSQTSIEEPITNQFTIITSGNSNANQKRELNSLKISHNSKLISDLPAKTSIFERIKKAN